MGCEQLISEVVVFSLQCPKAMIRSSRLTFYRTLLSSISSSLQVHFGISRFNLTDVRNHFLLVVLTNPSASLIPETTPKRAHGQASPTKAQSNRKTSSSYKSHDNVTSKVRAPQMYLGPLKCGCTPCVTRSRRLYHWCEIQTYSNFGTSASLI